MTQKSIDIDMRGSSQLLAIAVRFAPWMRFRRMSDAGITLDLRDPVQTAIARNGLVYETETTRFLRSSLGAGDVFVDVGANWGYFTCVAAAIVGQHGLVFAIEAVPSTYRVLLKTIERNRIRNAVAFSFAASDTDQGRVQMVKRWYRLSSGAYMDGHRGNVLTRTIDSLIAEQDLEGRRVSVVKIDVEGAELLVLRGMRATLRTHRPILVVEASTFGFNRYGYAGTELQSFLAAQGYLPTLSIDDRGNRGTRPYENERDATYGNVVYEPSPPR